MSKSADADIERRENKGLEEIDRAEHNGNDDFVFDEKAHAYFLNGNAPTIGPLLLEPAERQPLIRRAEAAAHAKG